MTRPSNAIAVDGETRIMPVLGDPIRQARSPAVLSQLFAERNARIVCLPLHVSSGDLEVAWSGLRSMQNVVAMGVTVPHKKAALSLCDSLDPAAERLGGVNLVRRERDGSFRGYQFDGVGFIRGLNMQAIAVNGKHCQLVGAGGAASAVAFALAEAGAREIAILNRDFAKAKALAVALNDALGSAIAHAGDLSIRGKDTIVINATSVGMAESDPLPMPEDFLVPGAVVADVIARPEFTRLLKTAREKGATIHSGIHMIAAQAPIIADCICEIWRGQHLPETGTVPIHP